MVKKVRSGVAGRGYWIWVNRLLAGMAVAERAVGWEYLEQQRRHGFHLRHGSMPGSQVKLSCNAMSRACASLLGSQLGNLARQGELYGRQTRLILGLLVSKTGQVMWATWT